MKPRNLNRDGMKDLAARAKALNTDPTTLINAEFAAFLGIGMIFTDEFREAPEGQKTFNLLVKKMVAGIESPDEIEAILRPIAEACPPEFLKSTANKG
jgi:hypothetical protein